MVYVEGETATCFFVLLDGTVVMRRRVQGDDVEVARTNQRGVYAGATAAYVRSTEPLPYPGSMQAITDCRFFVLPADEFGDDLPRVVPDGDAPAGGHLPRDALQPGHRRPARAAARARPTDRRADPRAEQPGRCGRASHLVAARAGRDDAAQAGQPGRRAAQRRRPDPAGRTAGGGRRAAGQAAQAARRCRPATPRRSSRSGWTSTGCVRAGRSPRRSSVAGIGPAWLDRVAGEIPRDAPRGRPALDHLHPRHRAADARDRGRDAPDLVAGRRGQAVLPAGPRRAPGHRRAGRPGQHAGHAQRQAQGRRGHRGQGLRRRPARHPGLPGRAQPGVDQPDRQRDRRHGGTRHADPADGPVR